ncbi:DUF6502 family protein [Jannaschia aquimarina]|uniref:DUF6502 family protein n=1 Tax=Jannaschia aquimarina TaxID=935700 RepID=UPI00069654F9|nr:DUF6502 family protein [Jannaschia aquimarina]
MAEFDDLLTRLFVPLARLAMGRGFGFRDVVDPLKRAFLIVAQEREGKQTDSRLSLATGLQRRDVVRLRADGLAPREPSSPARIVSDWLRQHSVDGRPTPLPRLGPAPSFEALARAVRQDVHPRTLLDLLVEAGTVRVADDTVELLSRAYAPGRGSSEQLAYLADNLHDHGAAAVANVLDGPRFFDRAAHYSGLTFAQAEALGRIYEAKQMNVLQVVGERAAGMQGDGPVRVRFGGYGYWEEGE